MEEIGLAIIGAGSVRCGPPIVASLASYFGERSVNVALWDADAERLDLFERFARTSFSVLKCTHSVFATLEPEEALVGADRVVLALDVNCAKKYLKAQKGLEGQRDEGTRAAEGEVAGRRSQEDRSGELDFESKISRRDSGTASEQNPKSKNSDFTDSPTHPFTGSSLVSDEALIEAALEGILKTLDPDADILSLLPPSQTIPQELYARIDWPAELTEEERPSVPHQVLRWMRAEDYVEAYVREHERSPLKAWLDDVHTAPLVGG
jgi:hypothetical protein